MFLELLKQLFPIFVLRDVANKKTVVIVRYGNTNSFPFLQLVIIQLKMHNSGSQDMRIFRYLFLKVSTTPTYDGRQTQSGFGHAI